MSSATNWNSEILLMGDSQLWCELRKGDDEVFRTLFYKFYNNLYFYGTKLVNDKNLIIDAIQDVFSNLWKDRKRLSNVQNNKAYLFTIFRNRLLKAPQKNLIPFSL